MPSGALRADANRAGDTRVSLVIRKGLVVGQVALAGAVGAGSGGGGACRRRRDRRGNVRGARRHRGGARASGTNDKAGSKLNLVRWVSARAIKETFSPPLDYRYPFMGEK